MNQKKFLSLVLCCVLSLVLLTGSFSAMAESSEVPSNYMIDNFMSILQFDGYKRQDIKTVTFLDTTSDIPANVPVWDFSQQRNESVLAWLTEEGDMFIAGEGGVTATNCEKLFNECSKLTSIQFNGCFHTTGVASFSNMFNGCSMLTELDLTGFDTSSATDMSAMFRNCGKLAPVDLSSFDTSKVTDMTEMFYTCSAMLTIDLTSFDTSNVTSMKSMFDGCGWTTSIDVSSFNTSNVTDFSRMFLNCKEITQLNLSGFDFSAGKDFYAMFMWAENLADIGCTITVPEGAQSEKMFANSGLK